MQSKYVLKNFLLTPEHYKYYPKDTPNKRVKCLYISSNNLERPKIFTDDPSKILEVLYPDVQLRLFLFQNGFHMYMYPVQGLSFMKENILATRFLRMHTLNDIGMLVTDAIYGDVCIFGTSFENDSEKSILNCSVPYEISEQVFRLYDKIK